jgi:hypothetical protein
MEQTISTVLAKNEVINIAGPGAVKVAFNKSVVVSTAKSGTTLKSVATGVATSTLTPLFGFVILVGGLVLMVKVAEKYATAKK